MSVRLSINHICAPRLQVNELLELSSTLGLDGIELRNDLGNPDPLAGSDAEEVRATAARLGQRIFSINALQRCDDRGAIDRIRDELAVLLDVASAVDVPAIVMCPTNDTADDRSDERRYDDLVRNLDSLAPLFEAEGKSGLLEPLGFSQSALRSHARGFEAIEESGRDCFGVVLDTFHFALGPETLTDLSRYPVDRIGLIHLSWVNHVLPLAEYTDAHRVLIEKHDTLGNEQQLKQISALGYDGVVSFEPFAAEVQRLSAGALSASLAESARFVREMWGLE